MPECGVNMSKWHSNDAPYPIGEWQGMCRNVWHQLGREKGGNEVPDQRIGEKIIIEAVNTQWFALFLRLHSFSGKFLWSNWKPCTLGERFCLL